MRVALAPVTALVWGYDKIKDFLEPAVAQRLANLRPEHIITPSPMVAGPAIEALRFAGHDPTLREMYATLLATAMDANRVRDAHPAFVEIIRQLTADEARIVGLFATSNDFPIIRVAEILTPSTFDILLDRFSILGDKAKCEFPGLISAYIDNIVRLGLANVSETATYFPPQAYEELHRHPTVTTLIESLKAQGRVARTETHILNVTTLGRQFCRACTG